MRLAMLGVGVVLLCLHGSAPADEAEARALVKKHVGELSSKTDYIIPSKGPVKHLRLKTAKFKGLTNQEMLKFRGLPLETLDLSGCTTVGSFGLLALAGNTGEHLGNLKHLNLSNTKASGLLDMLGSLKNITSIELDHCEVTFFALRNYGGYKTLKSLSLDHSPMTDQGMQYLAGLPNLRNLELRGTKVTGSGLIVPAGTKGKKQGFANLQQLNLDGCPVTDTTVKNLKALKNLKFLVLSNTKVSLAAAKELKKNLPKCSILTDFCRLKGKEEAGYALIRVK